MPEQAPDNAPEQGKAIAIDFGALPAETGSFSATGAAVSLTPPYAEILFVKGLQDVLAALAVRIPINRVAPILDSSGPPKGAFFEQLAHYCQGAVPATKEPDYNKMPPARTGLEYASFFQMAHAEDEAEFLFVKISPYKIHSKDAKNVTGAFRVYIPSTLMLAVLNGLRRAIPVTTE